MSEHSQFAEDLALYAAGALDAKERAQMEKHLETCAACRRELEEVRGDVALLAFSVDDAQPPARARRRLMSAIAAEARASGVPSIKSSTAPARDRWVIGWAWAASIAAGALLAWSLGMRRESGELRQTVAGLELEYSQQQQQLDQAKNVVALLSDPSAAQFTLAAASARKQPEGRAIYQPARRSFVFLASNLPDLPAQKTYQLWLIPSAGAPVPAGLFKPDARGSATVVNAQGLSLPAGVMAKAFAVTVEPDGGSPAPTSTPIMSGAGA